MYRLAQEPHSPLFQNQLSGSRMQVFLKSPPEATGEIAFFVPLPPPPPTLTLSFFICKHISRFLEYGFQCFPEKAQAL